MVREADPKPVRTQVQINCVYRFYDGFAAERGGAAFRQAPSPQKPAHKLKLSILADSYAFRPNTSAKCCS
ncbi:hypothetical protein D9M71_845560 [compost metagenome]